MLEGLFRSPRPIARANGPHEVRSVPPGPSLAAALLGTRRVSARQGRAGEKSGLFEHPAGGCSCCATRGDHRCSAGQNGFSAAWKAENSCYRPFSSVASNVFILLRMFSSPASPGHRTGRWGRHDGRLCWSLSDIAFVTRRRRCGQMRGRRPGKTGFVFAGIR